MVRSITGSSKQISTYVTNNSKNLTKGLSEIASKRISNSSTSNLSKDRAQNAIQIVTDSRSAVENGLRSYITNRESNSSSNNSTNIGSDNRIIYGVDSSSIGGILNNLYSTNSMDGVRVASLDTIEISDESRQLFVAKSSNNKYLDIAGTVFDIVTDFIPGVGTAKDIYNVYQTIVNPKSSVKDIAWALADLVPGPSIGKLKKLADVIIDKFNLSSSTSKKLKDALVKTSAKKIKDMDVSDTKKLINASEGKNRGHTLAAHMNITDEQLQYRSTTKEKQGASKFSNHKVMQEFVNTVLVDEADRIASWLKNSKSEKYVSSKHKSKTPLGYGYKYNNQKKSYSRADNLNTGIVVLTRDDSNEHGFIVKTSYPYVK